MLLTVLFTDIVGSTDRAAELGDRRWRELLGQYERLFTAAFLHANVLHLATNMLTLYIVGAPLELLRGLRPGPLGHADRAGRPDRRGGHPRGGELA